MGLSPRTSQTSVAGASRRAVMLWEVSSNRAGSGRKDFASHVCSFAKDYFLFVV